MRLCCAAVRCDFRGGASGGARGGRRGGRRTRHATVEARLRVRLVLLVTVALEGAAAHGDKRLGSLAAKEAATTRRRFDPPI